MRHLLTTLTLCTTLTLHAQPPSYVPTNGLVGWWPFNGNANDESGNGNNGTVNAATLTDDRFGNSGSAYLFNGIDNYISIDDSPSLDVQNVTISAWYNCFDYGLSSQLNQGHIVSKRETSGWGQSFQLALESTTPVNGIWATYTIGSNGSVSYNSNSDLVTNAWVHAVYTHDNNSAKLYINGVAVSASSVIGGLSSNNLPMWIGARPFAGSNSAFYHGTLDDIGIWNRALTPAEVQALYSAQPQTPCISPDPVSFTGLGSSYTLADAPVTLVGNPAGGVFIGPGVTGSTFDPAGAGLGTHSITYSYLDGNNCINTAGLCTEVTANVGVGGSHMATGGVRVFPNPNRGQFTVELELTGLVGMQVFDARGALVHNEVFTASGSRTQRTLDLSAFAKGSYTLQVDHDGQRVSQTVVVE